MYKLAFRAKKIMSIGIAFLALCFLAILTLMSIDAYKNSQSIVPKYDKIDISSIIQKPVLEESDYNTLFYQTGLGKIAIDNILLQENGEQAIFEYQENFFHPPERGSGNYNLLTKEDVFVNEDGEKKSGFTLAPVEEGYVLVTKSTNTLGFRHGHAAIVVDKENGKTLEARSIGESSRLNDISDWTKYDSFMMLKLKDASTEQLQQIASYAKENLVDIRYHLLTGMVDKKSPLEQLEWTHCSHLVWYPFMEHGYDIDATGGWIVTPKDIANSPLFEIVQIYGFSPDELWD